MIPVEQRKRHRRLLQHCRELRIELDQLRLENQKLHAELEPCRGPRRLLDSFRDGVRRIIPPWSLGNGGAAEGPGSEFRPYQVRHLHPPEPNRTRILHVIANFYTGGSARLIVDLVEHLGHRYEQEVLTCAVPVIPAYLGLRIHHQNRYWNRRQVLTLLNRFRPDCIHLHFVADNRYWWGVADWSWYHSVFQVAGQAGYRIIENVNIPVAPYVSDAVDRYVFVSNYVKARFGKLGARNTTIYPGSDLSFFSRTDPRDVPDDCIGMVYRLEGDKLNEHAIEVFIEVVRRRPRTRVIIVGGGSYLEPYRNRVDAEGLSAAFTFTDYVAYEKLPAYLEKMSVFVAPVHNESFGQVSPFAMGMAIPIAGYRVGALPEILGGTELLASPGDSESLAGIITELLDDRERRIEIGVENRTRAEHLFSVEAMIGRYRALYEALASPT